VANLPATLTFTPSFQGQGSIAGAGTAGGINRETVQIGANGFPTDTPPVSQAAAANGVYQCQQWYQGQYTIASSAHTDIDLTSLTNGIGGAVDFSAGGGHLKFAYFAIVSPDGGATKQLTIGPQSVTNALVAPFDASTDSLIVNARCRLIDCVEGTGHTVDSTHKIIRLSNTGSASITVQVFFMG
jgi:hypothetical protein